MSRPVISVVMATYNYGRFIEEAIDSVLSQEYPQERVQIVVVDDGSTDDTAERVKKYGSKIVYFRKPNGGQASALNLGFAEARGEIIALLDADDYFLPGKLARVAEAFERNPGLGMFYHPFLEFDMETKEQRVSKFPPLISGSPFEDLKKFVWYAGPGTCASFRRKFLDRLLPIPEEIRMLADGYLGSLIVFVAPILAVPECLSGYRFHGKNAYHADGNQSVEARKKRLPLYQVEFGAMRRWLADNGYTRKQIPVRVFLDCWNIYLEGEGFLLKPPSRLRFFWWTVRKNHADSRVQGWKFTVLRYLTCLSALILGYGKADQVDKWQGRTIRAYQMFFGGRSKQSPSGY
jgi:glycosyltransferase involved in cell wall biosynthesis